MKNGLSIQDKLLTAVLALEAEGRLRFSAEDLVVMAWRMYPEAFGLAGYTDKEGHPIYPNSNRVYAEIMGSKPLRKNGWIRKVGSKMYKLTEAGRSQAHLISEIPPTSSAEKWAIARDRIDFIRKLFDSRASTKFRAGHREDISFFDACGFWGISASSNAKDIWSRFADIKTTLATASESLTSRDAVRFKHGAEEFTAEDVEALRNIHAFLQERFKPETARIKVRTDER